MRIFQNSGFMIIFDNLLISHVLFVYLLKFLDKLVYFGCSGFFFGFFVWIFLIFFYFFNIQIFKNSFWFFVKYFVLLEVGPHSGLYLVVSMHWRPVTVTLERGRKPCPKQSDENFWFSFQVKYKLNITMPLCLVIGKLQQAPFWHVCDMELGPSTVSIFTIRSWDNMAFFLHKDPVLLYLLHFERCFSNVF